VLDLRVRSTAGRGAAYRQGRRPTILRALAGLPARQRAAVVLRCWEDLPIAAVARALDCSEGTVKSQTSRGLAALRARLGDPALAEGTQP
jgi:RNA polymerase sigma factor (sigma-70 family)